MKKKKKKPAKIARAVNHDYENATHRIWFMALQPCPVELGGEGVTGPYDKINIGPPPNAP